MSTPPMRNGSRNLSSPPPTPPHIRRSPGSQVPPPSPSRATIDTQYSDRLMSPMRRSTDGSQTSFSSPSSSLNSSLNTSLNTSLEYSDRFIPSRTHSNFSHNSNLAENASSNSNNSNSNTNHQPSNTAAHPPDPPVQQNTSALLNVLLKSELLENGQTKDEEGNMMRFKSPREDAQENATKGFVSLSPIGSNSHRLLSSPRKTMRKIPKVPFKVLDAPALQDDFYLNLVDWSALNVLAVGLGSCVYLWSACTSKVTKLCDLGPEDVVTSVSWTSRGTHLAVGTNLGETQIWEAAKCKKIRTMRGHSARVGTMSWMGHVLASGSRDRLIYLRDVRSKEPFVTKLAGHKQEVCGLKWSADESQLASGGNDNKLFIWNLQSSQPVNRFNEHTAAVKAIAWSPHQHGLLCSGGGTADRCIRFWNTLSGNSLNCIDTGSQVCNLQWSKNCNELVSTHGYSLNQIILWRYPSMTKIATLTGHTYRVLYLAMSPDGSTIVTGAGDETLRFWQVFPDSTHKSGKSTHGLLFPSSPGSVVR
ncbi:hypothetical protein TrLO_g15776 [Triparma laevis f. longispina]|uniref:CDC20/Fizzy WD40 domain-containing protein n=2 Tax=Triparma laevis f. longispina TaxID=1714387 RepID=A0A9W7FEV6_9STRA|nr:hypothetical protein TrLO_g15776 [Triparma laevis f. longispina]